MAENIAEKRLVEAIDELPNLIKIVKAGKVDEVIRIEPLESRVLDLMTQPESEEWENIRRLVYLRAPIEERGKDPVPVGTRKDWTLVPEQVPVVKLMGEVPDDLKLNYTSRQEKQHLFNLNKQSETKEVKKGPGRPKKAEVTK